MSEERPTSTRRQFAKGLGGAAGITSLAGCADYLGGNDQRDERPEQDTPENNTPVDNGSQGTEDPSDGADDDDTPGDDQEQASNYTWEDILESEQEFYEKNVDQGLKEVVQLANNQDTVGESFEFTPESDIYNNATGGFGYSHGGEYFDVEHFKNADFIDALRDARTLTAVKSAELLGGNPNVSGTARDMGQVVEKMFEDIRNQKLRKSTYTDGHGFWPVVISPGEDPYTLDSTNDIYGKTWENPMSQRSGSSPINQFNEDKLGTLFGLEYQTMIERLSDQVNGEGQTFVNRSLLIDANEQFSTPEIPYDKMVPAIAVLNYQDKHDPGRYHMLHAESWNDLPSFNPGEDDFQQYRKNIEDRLVHFDTEEESRPYRMGEKWEE